MSFISYTAGMDYDGLSLTPPSILRIRNPLLMATHYAVAIIAALLCGFFFYQVTNDIPGFQ